MRVCVTARPALDLLDSEPPAKWIQGGGPRLAGSLAPGLALPWIVNLRYGIAFGLLVFALFARYSLKQDLPLAALAIPAVVILVTNAVLSRVGGSLGDSRSWMGALFCVDTACLTVVLALTGGPTNPFTLLYLVHITLSAVILNRIWTWLLGLLSTAAYAFLFWFHKPFPLLDPAEHGHVHVAHLQAMFAAFALAAVLISLFIGEVSETLRKAERDTDRTAKNDRLSSLVTLAAGATHELATPLGTIAVVAKELEHCAEASICNAELLEDARLVRSEVERCRLILQRMNGRDTGMATEEAEPTKITELLASVVQQFPPADQARIEVSEALEPTMIRVPQQAFRGVLASLLRNALQADASGKVLMSAGSIRNGIRFTIQDHGAGMPDEVLKRIAEPFFTTKEPGYGMGLGTFLARMLAERLGGVLVFDSAPGARCAPPNRLSRNLRRRFRHWHVSNGSTFSACWRTAPVTSLVPPNCWDCTAAPFNVNCRNTLLRHRRWLFACDNLPHCSSCIFSLD